MAKGLIVAGLILLAAGALWLLAERLGLRLGRLPGDIVIERDNFRFYFPLATGLLISAVLSLIIWLIGRL